LLRVGGAPTEAVADLCEWIMFRTHYPWQKTDKVVHIIYHVGTLILNRKNVLKPVKYKKPKKVNLKHCIQDL
jgi:hypothetical protein